ncbi:hypothetical protein DUG83_23470 [Vibrio parahaemolyticus]|nr:hypothetical protein [Vibrio parahaemolyticus]EGS6764428.1 hypothetical protein [Vibrio parahaemolyticus]EGY8744451.1 hypothetical protein [Vibrio parahaemolyticus]EHE6936406.1 hypothetical protein [Vibrio parahaemolyticus]ELB2274764.1 hypothetical protein [Vibrio parahaemolyticus]
MIDFNKGLKSEVKFVVASTYDAFVKQWGELNSPKLSWVNTWSSVLSEHSAETIRIVTEHCLKERVSCPTLGVFNKYCERLVNGEDLYAPMLSKEEQLAQLILKSLPEEIAYYDQYTLSDALMIAASIHAIKANQSTGLDWNSESVDSEFKSRAGMFGTASIDWLKQAELGKGNWVNELGNTKNKV